MSSNFPSSSDRWAPICKRTRSDGTICYLARHRVGGEQISPPFDHPTAAEAFRAAAKAHGAVRALDMYGIEPARRRSKRSGRTVTTWLAHHIDHLSGVERRTPQDYRGYLRNHIASTRRNNCL
jgi:hypothetical protein